MKYRFPLNAAQLRGVESPVEGSYRVMSSAGTGKTVVIEYRYAYLVEQGVDPRDIVAVVFNKRNADEFLDRITAVVPQIAGTQAANQISSIHAFCFRLFKSDEVAFPGASKYRVADYPTTWFKAEKWSIKKVIQEAAESLWPVEENRPGWKEIWVCIQSAKAHGLTPAESAPFFVDWLDDYHGERVYETGLRVWRSQKALRVLTFADMLLLVDVQLQRDSAFRSRCQARFTHILCDEGQDTSEQAMRILATVAQPQDNFFLVGDPDQLLYRFAGATPEANLLDGFEERYPNGEMILMGINYRSTHTNVDTARELIANNYSDLGGPYDQKYMKKLAAFEGAEQGTEIEFTAFLDPEDEAEGVATEIELYCVEIEEDGMVVSGDPGDIFVGARTKAQLGYLEGPLLRREIPYINITGQSFWEGKHVANVVAYLRLAHDTSDSAAFKRVYNVASNWMVYPWGKQEGQYCHHRFLGGAFLNACQGSYDGMDNAWKDSWGYGKNDLTSFVNELKHELETGPAAVLRYILDNCYVKFLKTDEGLVATDEAENGLLENLETVIVLAEGYETVLEFLTYVDKCVAAAKAARDGDWNGHVILSTVHRLKGLERPIVFGIGWGEGSKTGPSGEKIPAGLLPHSFSLGPPPQFGILPIGEQSRIEDERCIAFVLATRAKEKLYLSYPMEYRGATFGPSRFAIEMGLVTIEPNVVNLDEIAAEVELDTEAVCGYCDGEGRELVHLATDSAENIWQDCPICTPRDDMVPVDERIAAEIKIEADEFKAAVADEEETELTPEDIAALEPEDGCFAWDPKYDFESIVSQFPFEGKFEGNIYRPSAIEIMSAMPKWIATINHNQLVMEKHLGGNATVLVYTTIYVGEIAGGTGEDSIRVVRRDDGRDGRKFWFKNNQDWVTRQVPKDCDTQVKAVAHLVSKIEKQVKQMTVECPDCGGTAVKCWRGKGRDMEQWERCLECRWSTW